MSTKEKLLAYLKENRGEWVSGEFFSKKMLISRSAIWKHIRNLREEGYGIVSSPKKGYFLQHISQMVLPNEIREGLDTTVFGQRDIIYLTEIDSTNRKAKELANRGTPEGTLVISEKQTKGRGRKGRSWFSPSHDGIYISLILRPDIPPDEAPKISLLTAVTVAETLLSLTPLDVKIKWPNDILINEKKVAGILTEISTELDVINHVVVGLGLNVNTQNFPEDIFKRATSVYMETGERFSRVKIIREYLKQIEKYYDLFTKRGIAPVIKRWNELTHMIGRRVMVEVVGNKHVGKAQGLDADGFLILKDDRGRTHRIISGDVTLM